MVWGVFDVMSSRRDLLAARQDLSRAASNLGTATDAEASRSLREATDDAVRRTERADKRLTRSPLLKLADFVPVVRGQRRDLLRAVDVAHGAAQAGARLAGEVERVRSRVAFKNATLDLGAIATLAGAADEAGNALAALPRTHRGGQWGPLARATRELDTVVGDTAERLVNGAGTMRVARRLLGSDGPTRLFIALQNNAEMRDQGMVLSYAVAQGANGSLQVSKFGSITELELKAPVRDVTLPRGTAITFGELAPLQYWQSVNATADTAIAGRLMASMYRAATGDTVDAVVALDVPALSSLLAITGPVTVAGVGQPVTSENASTVLLNDLYAAQRNNTTDREARQAILASVATTVIERIRNGSYDTSALARSLGASAAGGHMWVTSTQDAEQRLLENAGLSGRPGRVAPERTIHVAVQNATGTKLDWFVDPVVDVDVNVANDGTAVVKTTVTMENKAPVPTPSSEQFGPDGIVSSVAGLYRTRVYFWGPSTGDQIDSLEESGLRVNMSPTEVLPGEKRSVSFTTVLLNAVENGKLRLRFVPQPRVRPATLRVRVGGLGWDVAPSGAQSLPWERTIELKWSLDR